MEVVGTSRQIFLVLWVHSHSRKPCDNRWKSCQRAAESHEFRKKRKICTFVRLLDSKKRLRLTVRNPRKKVYLPLFSTYIQKKRVTPSQNNFPVHTDAVLKKNEKENANVEHASKVNLRKGTTSGRNFRHSSFPTCRSSESSRTMPGRKKAKKTKKQKEIERKQRLQKYKEQKHQERASQNLSNVAANGKRR